MGSINFAACTFYGSLSDIVGVKVGLALSKLHISKLLKKSECYTEYADRCDDSWLRIHSSAFEEVIEHILYCVGHLEHQRNLSPAPHLRWKYGTNPEVLEVIEGMLNLWMDFWKLVLADKSLPRGTKVDPEPFMRGAAEKYGKLGIDMALEMIVSQSVQNEIKMPCFPEIYGAIDSVKLDELFKSEKLADQKGQYLDQRFVNFLHRNFDEVDSMHWRKFEGLTADYFARLGHNVELGPGRDDNGVDVRVWPKESSIADPPAIIIQCKRQKATIEKVVVKALWTDVIDNKATSGLIVTTSRLAVGARAVVEARKYPIEEANRGVINKWIGEMRKPGMGCAG